VKRSEIHFGQRLFLKSLNDTSHNFGIEQALQDLKGTYVTIHEFSDYDNNCVVIIHPSTAKKYTLCLGDLTPHRETFNESEKPVLKLEGGKEAVFDPSLLSL